MRTRVTPWSAALLLALASAAHADLVPPPSPAQLACSSSREGGACTLGAESGTCVTRITRIVRGVRFDRRHLECLAARSVTPPLRACIGLAENARCAVAGGVRGTCKLVEGFLRCAR